MPITITPFPGGPAVIGWGASYLASSDFIGPLPSSAIWSWWVSNDIEGNNVVAAWSINSNTNPFQIRTNIHDPSIGLSSSTIGDGQTAYINVQLKETTGGPVLDSGQLVAPWNGTAQDLPQILEGGGQGALTPAQAQQLTEVHESTFPATAIDALTLTPLQGDPVTGFVGAQLPFPIWGVIVRMTAIDPALVPETPDGDYFFNSIAVVRIFRGQDLWLRVPIHTSSKIISLFGEGLATSITTLLTVPWLLQMSIQVTFRPNCLGDVFLMRTP